MSEEVHVFSMVSAKEGSADELRELLTALVEPTKAEPGNLKYMLHENPKKLGKFYIFEAYKDEASADSHMRAPHMTKTMNKARPLVAGPPMIIQTKLLAGE